MTTSVLVTWVPHWHDLGLVNCVVRTVLHGVPCHVVSPSIGTIRLWFETISAVRGTMSGAPDFALRLAARLVDPRRVDLSSLRAITNGGEPVRATTVEGFERRFGIPGTVCPGYGLAEATLGVSTQLPGGAGRVDAHGHAPVARRFRASRCARTETPTSPGRSSFAVGPCSPATSATRRRRARRCARAGCTPATWLSRRDGLLYVLGRTRAMIDPGVPCSRRASSRRPR